MAVSTHNIVSRLISPGVIFLGGFFLLIIGGSINYFYGLKGELLLEAGKKNILSSRNLTSADSATQHQPLSLVVTLDSLTIQPYTPDYEIRLSRKDTIVKHADYQAGATYAVAGIFPLEQMKIREIEKTDLRFRLKDFYPNFQFSYQYPLVRDTIEPKAPGITLELKTKEGTPIVTLRSDQPAKHLLGDIVSLGASLAFYWNMPVDSIRAIASKNAKGGNKIVFSGADTTIYFILKDSISTQPLKENMFYRIPGQDSSGFKILFCYPDVNYLKAVPSSKGMDLINPVAHVEIWKEGGSARDAFLYPESRNRKGGDFDIPDSDYRLGLGLNKQQALKHCNCSFSVQRDSSEVAKSLESLSGSPVMYHGYRFSPIECKDRLPKVVLMEVVYQPGRTAIIFGFALLGLAILLFLVKRFRANSGSGV